MLNEQTAEKLIQLRLRTMADVLREQLDNPVYLQMSFDDRFGMIVDRQWADRKSAKIANLRKRASFKASEASIEGIEYHAHRKLNKDLILQLATGKYIRDKQNVIIMGASGAGKTYLACALGNSACRQLFRVKYVRLPEFLVDMAIARGDGTYKKLMAMYKKYDLLIFDEWLLVPLTDNEKCELFEIIESRYGEASTIFIAQSAPTGWYQMIGEGRIADAILDRIIYNSHELLIQGDDSMRKRRGLNP